LERIKKAKRKIKPQEAGIDILGELPLEEGFLKYQGMVVEIYDKIAKEESNFITIDGNRPLKDVQMDIRKILGEYIDNSL